MNIKNSLLIPLALSVAAMAIGCGGTESETEFASAQQPLFDGTAFYDSGTQCTVGGKTMHCCPIVNGSPSVMIGARLDQNVFKCQRLGTGSGNPLVDTSFLDTSTQRNGMHACPSGSLMRGLHVNQNLLTCVFPAQRIITGEEFVDSGTQDGFMHVCGSPQNLQYAMGGIRADQNRFTCDTDGQSI